MAEKALDRLRSHLQPGSVYRRADLKGLSSNLDRHLGSLVAEGSLKKVRRGLYQCPRETVFGEAPPEEDELLEAFLKSDEFLAYSPNAFNRLGLGTTQLYNSRTVLNQKRHGAFVLDGRNYFFHRKLRVPRELTREVLLVELLNNLKKLAEDPEALLGNVKASLPSFETKALVKASQRYGTYSTQKRLEGLVAAS